MVIFHEIIVAPVTWPHERESIVHEPADNIELVSQIIADMCFATHLSDIYGQYRRTTNDRSPLSLSNRRWLRRND